jgi:hypothetical protein
VLGFEVHQNDDEPGVIHAVSGKAHIRFGAHDYSPNDWDRPRPVGSTIVFFETDNVESIHAAVRARGGKPSDLEMVNGIKMRVFEIRDPDGRTVVWSILRRAGRVLSSAARITTGHARCAAPRSLRSSTRSAKLPSWS